MEDTLEGCKKVNYYLQLLEKSLNDNVSPYTTASNNTNTENVDPAGTNQERVGRRIASKTHPVESADLHTLQEQIEQLSQLAGSPKKCPKSLVSATGETPLSIEQSLYRLECFVDSQNSHNAVTSETKLGNQTNLELPREKAQRTQNKHTIGRPRIDEQFPGIIDVARNFIEENGYEAHRRRALTTGNCGVTLQQVRDHLFSVIPGLEEARPNLGIKTIHRWMKAPHSGRRVASQYKELIDCRVPAKKNSKRIENQNAHYYSARVKYTLEFAAQHPQEVFIYSLDNKNKLRVCSRSPAIDRRAAVRKFFMSEDSPDYYDHDFPTPGYLITPCGYLELVPKLQPELTVDEVGREHYSSPTTGDSLIVNRCPMTPVNSQQHMVDIAPLIEQQVQKGKRVGVFIVDGGADYNANHASNEFFYCRLFRNNRLDGLIVTSNCPGFSALNPIEHLWAPITNKLVSVYLPDCLPNESSPPCEQSLPEEERVAKEKKVFENAMCQLDKYLEGMTFNGGSVTVKHVSPFSNIEDEYKDVHTALTLSATALRSSRYNQEYLFMIRHMDRRYGTLIFRRCEENSCVHCTSLGEPSSALLRLRKFPSPVPSPDSPNIHFQTYIQSCAAIDKIQGHNSQFPDSEMPLIKEKQLGSCRLCSINSYVFTSVSDRRNHNSRIHPKRKLQNS